MRTDQIDRVGMANNPRTKNAKEHYSEQRFLELFLIITVLGITALFWYSPTFELALLSLYFLPVTLGGFFLGRYRASMLTLFCVLCASGCVLLTPLVQSPLTIGITLFVWTCVMAITVFLIGTLSDQRQRELADLHECHKTDTLLDMLTGVANRRAFENELNRRSAEWHHRQIDYSLLLVDIDHFKKFNDIYGHQVGDAVLRGVAQQIKDSVRETDLVARYGGEEIAVIMPETTEEEVKQIGERVREGSVASGEGAARGLRVWDVGTGTADLVPAGWHDLRSAEFLPLATIRTGAPWLDAAGTAASCGSMIASWSGGGCFP